MPKKIKTEMPKGWNRKGIEARPTIPYGRIQNPKKGGYYERHKAKSAWRKEVM